jgi:cellulose synthase/poly-beta-1,6-N-acetylglucosamine synthase-like glycosyltransferase
VGIATLVLFWIPVAAMVYNWLIFPLLLVLAVVLRTRRPRRAARPEDLPCVTVLIAAWNEEDCIAEKLSNCLAFDYPPDKIEIAVGTDAVTDRTNEIVMRFASQGVRLDAVPERLGKSAVLNRLVSKASGDLILFTDADVMLAPDALRRAVERFENEKVGTVLFHYERRNEAGHSAEGIWDRYENWLKKLEGHLGAAVGAYGWAMMVRKALCLPIPPETVNDDYVLGTRPFRWGYEAVYEPRARSWTRTETARVEFTRKARISRGNVQAFLMMPDLFLPKHGIRAWVLFSHKFLRWITPFLMLGILIGSALAVRHAVFSVMFVLQLAVYLTTPLVPFVRGVWKRLMVPQYYAWANAASLVGYWQYFFGRRLSYNWLRTVRR